MIASRRIRRRDKPLITERIWNLHLWIKHFPANMGKDSYGMNMLLPLSDVMYVFNFASVFSVIWNINFALNLVSPFFQFSLNCLKYTAQQYLESVNCRPGLAVRELNHSVAQSRKSDWYSRPGKKLASLRRRWFIWLDLDEQERHGAGPLADSEHGLPSYYWFLSGLRSYEQRERVTWTHIIHVTVPDLY